MRTTDRDTLLRIADKIQLVRAACQSGLQENPMAARGIDVMLDECADDLSALAEGEHQERAVVTELVTAAAHGR